MLEASLFDLIQSDLELKQLGFQMQLAVNGDHW